MSDELKIVVCVKQVPVVSELPWDRRTGALRRETADGAMNPACRRALEAALRIKSGRVVSITAVTMGPPMAEEILREAVALGADRGALLTDRRMAGADTLATSFTLAAAIKKECPDFDLVLCGATTTDSETRQVGPQLAEELGAPGAACVERIDIRGAIIRVRRVSDDFLETLEIEMPAVLTISDTAFEPRYVTLAGLEDAFEQADIVTLDATALGLDPDALGGKGSPTRILNVFSPTAEKKNTVLRGDPKKIVQQLFEKFENVIGGVLEKDLKPHE